MAAGDGELAPLAACLVAAHLADPAAAERRDAEKPKTRHTVAVPRQVIFVAEEDTNN